MADLKESVFDLLKYGIDRKVDSERREAVVITEPTVQHQMNSAGNAQQIGSTASANPIAGMPTWAQYTLAGSGVLLASAVLLKVAS